VGWDSVDALTRGRCCYCSDRAGGTVVSNVRLVVLLHVGGCRHHGPAGHRVPPATRVLVPGRRAVAAGVLPSRRHVRIHSVTVT